MSKLENDEVGLHIIASVGPEVPLLMLGHPGLLAASPNLRGTETTVVLVGQTIQVVTPGLPTIHINLYLLAGSATALAERIEKKGNNG